MKESVVLPAWQYRQSYEQVLAGIRSTPRDNPSLREDTGPKTWAIKKGLLYLINVRPSPLIILSG